MRRQSYVEGYRMAFGRIRRTLSAHVMNSDYCPSFVKYNAMRIYSLIEA